MKYEQLSDVELIYKSMEEHKYYTLDDLFAITGMLPMRISKALMKLQVGGLISGSSGLPRKRRYITNQTTLPLAEYGRENSQYELTA